MSAAHDDPPFGRGPWLLVLDIGSSSVRAWFYDQRGRGLDPGPEAQRGYAWRNDPAGTMECDAETILGHVVEAVDAALAHARGARLRVGGVAVAAFWHSLLGLDAAGAPVTPVLGWGDNRAAEEAVRLRDTTDEESLHRRTGCFLHPSYPLVKLRWLRHRDPPGFARAASWVSFPEYLEQRLLGRRRCSVSMASGTGLLDVHRLQWDAEALELAGIGAGALSDLVDADAPLRGLADEFARRWPELAEVDWFPALGDGACANLGSGAIGLDRIGVTVGTSAAARALWEPSGPVQVPDGLWCYRLDGRRWVAGGALSNGGNAVAFLRGLLDLPPEREWEARVADMLADAHGLTILPFLVGERGPGWRSETQAVVVGLRLSTRPDELIRAWMEAISYRIAGVCSRLDKALGTEPRVVASGGALHASPVWAQILADALGRSVTFPIEREATARGAAVVALAQLGWIADIDVLEVEEADCYLPRQSPHLRYRAAMKRQDDLHAALAPWLSIASSSTQSTGDS